jgi:hypothetical protein
MLAVTIMRRRLKVIAIFIVFDYVQETIYKLTQYRNDLEGLNIIIRN